MGAEDNFKRLTGGTNTPLTTLRITSGRVVRRCSRGSKISATARVESEQAWSNADVELTASWFM